ncbi:MAG: DUF2442 domain-containing protein [Blastocatellia bacterium]
MHRAATPFKRERASSGANEKPWQDALNWQRQIKHACKPPCDSNGATLMIPAHLIQGLQNATAKALAEIEILGVGSDSCWPQLEVDISIAGLSPSIFRSQAWMKKSGCAGGKVTSEKKKAAAQFNGKRGGRPRTNQTSRLKKAA